MSKIVVVGSINMDIVIRLGRFPLHGETVFGSNLQYYPGGKGANQAVAAARTGIATVFVGAVGGDASADALLNFMRANAVDVSRVEAASGESSGTALILVDDQGENEIVVVSGANSQVSEQSVNNAPIQRDDVVICQFEIPIETVVSTLRRGRACGATTILNPVPAQSVPAEILALADILVLNETELSLLADVKVTNRTGQQVIDEAIGAFRAVSPQQIVIVTRGAKGSIMYSPDRVVRILGRQVNAIDTTAAGDCFVGSLGARLAAGDRLEEALYYANVAASICVQRPGAGPSMPFRVEVVAAT